MLLSWGKCKGGVWCSFRRLILDDDLNNSVGVYIIWTELYGYRRYEYVGQGNIGDRIRSHRNDLRFKDVDGYVTWAKISDMHQRLAAEAYLSKKLIPAIGTVEHFSYELAVNLPWVE